MKWTRRARIVFVVLACMVGVLWMFFGWVASNRAIGNSQVLGALAAVVMLLLPVISLWQRRSRRTVADGSTGGPPQAALEYLANETLRYWRIQAKVRRITTPSPASVRWTWAGEDVAVPAADLQPELPVVAGAFVLSEPASRVLTAGIVTELRQQLYERLDDRCARIVVLGRPGAGKTAAMLLLLIDILKHRPSGSDQPVPVWLTLGGWNPQTTSLEEWAAATLTRDYPGLSAPTHGGPSTATQLIRTGRVALFLDGLDEIAPTLQGPALARIDRDAHGLRVVLTSRPAEYQTALADGRLYGAAVINILPVDADGAATFLLAEQLGERRHAWQQVTNHLHTCPDSVAARTLTTPLALSLARDTYTQADPADLLDQHAHPSPETLLRHLLARFLILSYPDPTENAYATRWLSWIARHMGTNRDLRWWDIPTWMPQRELHVARVFGLAIVGGFAGGLAGGLTRGLTVQFVFDLVFGLVFDLVFGLVFSLLLGLLFRLASKPRTINVRWPAARELSVLVGFVLAVGIASGLAFTLTLIMFRQADRIIFGIAFGLTAGLIISFVELWTTPLATAQRVDPWQVYRSDRRHTLAIGVMAGLAGGLIVGLGTGFMGGPAVRLEGGLMFGLLFALAGGLMGGLGSCMQLILVQTIWLLRGQRVRFLPLLQTALHNQVLRQAGSVYQFRHAALQDYLKTLQSIEPIAVRTREVDSDPS